MDPRTHASIDKSGVNASADVSIRIEEVSLTVFPSKTKFVESVLRVRPYKNH